MKKSLSFFSVILCFALLLAGFSGLQNAKVFAEDTREVILLDEYENAELVFDKAYSTKDVNIYANANVSFNKDYLVMITYPATTGEIVYDVSDMDFPLVQLEFDLAFYADPATVQQFITFYTSTDGVTYEKTSTKLLETPEEFIAGWYMCKIVNFAAIREGTKYVKIQMVTPGQFWDIQVYRTGFYAADAGDINIVDPVIKLETPYESVQAKDTVIDILEASATDDVTPSEQLTVNVTVKSPIDSIVTVTDNKFVLGMYGEYKIIYTTLDQHGNEGELIVTINSVDSEELEKGLPLWAIILIAGGGVVILSGVAIAIMQITKNKNKKEVK